MSLIPLSRNPDHALPKDTLDVRGWAVKTSLDREKVGKVDDILIDDRGRPRYLDVDLGLFNKHVLLPLRQSHVDGSDDVVWVDGLSKDQFDRIPEYAHDTKALTPAYEQRLEDDYRQAAAGRVDEREGTTVARGELSAGQDRLARLGDLEQFRVASADADPRGWQVVAGDGERIGQVDELIIDTVDMQARYLDCDVAEDRLALEPLDRHILIPLDHSRLDRHKKRVVVDGIFSRDLSRYPVYGGLPLSGDVERQIGAVYDRAADARREESAHMVREETVETNDPATDRFYRMRRRRAADEEREAERDTVLERPRSEPERERERMVARDRDDADRMEETVLDGPDQEVRIRVSGGDIVIEKRPLE